MAESPSTWGAVLESDTPAAWGAVEETPPPQTQFSLTIPEGEGDGSTRVVLGGGGLPRANVMEIVSEPFVELPKPSVEEDDTSMTRFAKGLGQVGVGAIESVESPLGLGIIAASALPGGVGQVIGRTAAAGFGIKSTLDGFKEAAQAYQQGDMEKAGRAVGQLLLGGAMVRGSVAGGKPSAVVRAEESGLKETVRAVEELPKTPPPLPESVAIEGTKTAKGAEALLPDLMEHSQAKDVFSQPFGIGKLPVLGRLIDPNARVNSPLDKSLATYHAERYGVGPAVASQVGLRLKAKGIEEAFQTDPKTGEIINVQPTKPGQSLYQSDVFEALQKDPDSYILTDAQKVAFKELESFRKEINKLEEKHGIVEEAIEDASYWPRIVIERPPDDVASLGAGGKVGSKQFFQKERMFETEAEGVAKGYRYEPSIISRAVSRTERLYKAIADKRLANDESLGARTRKDVENELREAYAEEIGAGSMTEAKLQKIVDSVERKGTVWDQPGFAGKIFTPETANVLNKAFPKADSSFRHNFVQVNNALKALRLSADLGVMLIQGLPTMYRNPQIWGKATANSLKALINDEVLPRYAEQNAEAITQLAQLGSSVGRLPEMLAGLEKGSLLERVPYVRVPFKAAGRQFETFLDVAKVELWKAWRDVTPPDQQLQVIRTIESQLSLGRMESIGVSRNRALAERALLLAPSYYRGAVNLVGAIGERGVSGQIARQALSAYIVGGTAMYYGIAKQLGMDDEEIEKRFDPTNSKFMMWQVEVNGKPMSIGFGGVQRSLLRLMANATKTSIEHPENWIALTPAKNPFVRWYRGHAAAVPGLTWSAITGRDFLGGESDLTTIVPSVVPMTAQPFLQSGNEDTDEVESAASVIGLSAFPENRPRQK